MSHQGRVLTALKILLMAIATLLSAAIAFCAVCYPLGWVGFFIGAMFGGHEPESYRTGTIGALVVGVGTGLIAAFFVGRIVLLIVRSRWK